MGELLGQDDPSSSCEPEHSEGLREIGGSAVWSLSSAKPGFGAEQLRDDSVETYWQSDGTQPHSINIQLPKKSFVAQVRLYLDFEKDESYTPARILIRAGSSYHDLAEIKEEKLSEPVGWVTFELLDHSKNHIHASLIQVSILAMHQNGRDTHVRQVKIFGPQLPLSNLLGLPTFKSSLVNRHALLK